MSIHNFIQSDEREGDNVSIIIPDVRSRGLCALVVPKFAHGDKEVKLFFPGGRVKEGETPVETAVRKLYEETNQYCEYFEYLFHQRKNRGTHLKAWFTGHSCSDRPLPRTRPKGTTLQGKPHWYSLSTLFTADKKESKLHPDHWEALKEFLAMLVKRDVFSVYAEEILLKDKETARLALRDRILSPETVRARAQ